MINAVQFLVTMLKIPYFLLVATFLYFVFISYL